METNDFLQLLYSRYNFRGVGSLFDKAKEVLLSIADGEPILDLSTLEIDHTFSKVTPKQASTILRELKRQNILEFLNTREGYVRQIKPSKRIHRWLNTSHRLIKWQMDLIDLRWLNLHDYKYAITIIDVFSKYAFMIPIPNKQGVIVAKKLDILFSLPLFHEIPSKPKLLLSDRGSEFIGSFEKYASTMMCFKFLVSRTTLWVSLSDSTKPSKERYGQQFRNRKFPKIGMVYC